MNAYLFDLSTPVLEKFQCFIHGNFYLIDLIRTKHFLILFFYFFISSLILDPESGLVTIGQDGPTFDRELVASHYLTVEARDQLGRGNRWLIHLLIKNI